ncbi:MAG: DUF2142 domain-containing protein, partial [Ethanoligenens sp.]
LVIVLFWKPIFLFLKKIDHQIFLADTDLSLPGHQTNHVKVFVLLCMTFGLFFIFLTPPFNVPDEAGHFEQSYYVAHGQLMPKVDAHGNVYGTIDKGYLSFRNVWPGVQFDTNKKVTYANIHATLESASDNTPAKIPYRYFYYPFILYIPQAVGMTVGKFLFHLFRMNQYYNTFQQMIFARLFNLFFYMVVVACAIKIIPFFKRTMLFVALMPMTIYVAASCSADTFVYAICFLAVAYILKLAYAKDVQVIGKKEIACLSGLCGLLLFSKSIYILVFGLCLLIPREKFKGMKRKLRSLLVAALIGCVIFGIWYATLKTLTQTMTPGSFYAWGKNGVAISKTESLQVHYILTHPIRYLMIMYNDFFMQRGYLVSFIGRFGWLDTIVPAAFTVFYATLLIVSALMEHFPFHLEKWKRLWMLILSGGVVVLVDTSQYVSWTSHPVYIGGLGIIGGTEIIGVQGRYFIPIALVALLLLANRFAVQFRMLGKMNGWFDRLANALVVASLNISIFYIFLRFWIA